MPLLKENDIDKPVLDYLLVGSLTVQQMSGRCEGMIVHLQ